MLPASWPGGQRFLGTSSTARHGSCVSPTTASATTATPATARTTTTRATAKATPATLATAKVTCRARVVASPTPPGRGPSGPGGGRSTRRASRLCRRAARTGAQRPSPPQRDRGERVQPATEELLHRRAPDMGTRLGTVGEDEVDIPVRPVHRAEVASLPARKDRAHDIQVRGHGPPSIQQSSCAPAILPPGGGLAWLCLDRAPARAQGEQRIRRVPAHREAARRGRGVGARRRSILGQGAGVGRHGHHRL